MRSDKVKLAQTPHKTKVQAKLALTFDSNALLPALFGQHDQNLARLEQSFGVEIASRGNRLVLKGDEGACHQVREVLEHLYSRLQEGSAITMGDVDGAVRMAQEQEIELLNKIPGSKAKRPVNDDVAGREIIKINTRKRVITPRSSTQNVYIRALDSADLVFAAGPAGTGKTYLAVAMAVSKLISGEVDRIILSRPAVEAGESLGYLPGDMKEKVDPYLRPLYDALHDTMPAEQVAKRIEIGEIEIAPLAFMRGRTLSHAFVILDEAQNTSPGQMKMFLTRLGENSCMAVTGDPSQVDLLPGMESGLQNAISLLDGVEGVSVITFDEKDVVRNRLVRRIIKAYDEGERKKPPATKKK